MARPQARDNRSGREGRDATRRERDRESNRDREREREREREGEKERERERDRGERRDRDRAPRDGRNDARDRGERVERGARKDTQRSHDRPTTSKATDRSDRDKSKAEQKQQKLSVLESLKDFPLKGGNGRAATEIKTADWNRTGTRIAASRSDGSLVIWKLNPKTGEQSGGNPMVINKTHGTSGCASDFSWKPQGEDDLATVGRDNTILCWNVVKGATTSEIVTEEKELKLISYSEDGKYLAAASRENLIFIDTSSNSIVQSVPLSENAHSICWNNGSDAIFVGLGSGLVLLLMKNENGLFEAVHRLEGHRSTINAMSLDPMGKFVAAASHEGVISIWSLADLSVIRTFGAVDQSIESLDISFDGELIGVTYRETNGAKIFRVRDGKELKTLDKCTPGRRMDEVIRFSPVTMTYLFTAGSGEVFTGINSGDSRN